MDINNLKATDLPYNTKVNMAKAVRNDEEIIGFIILRQKQKT